MREVLSRAARGIDGRFPDRPETEAAVRLLLARAFIELFDMEAARAQLDAAEVLLAPLSADELKLRLLTSRASLLETEGKFAEALTLLQEGAALAASANGTDGEGVSDALLAYQLTLGLLQLRTGDAAGALERFQENVPKLRERRGAFDAGVLTAEGNLGDAQLALGRLDEAHATHSANAEVARGHYGDDDLRSAIYARPAASVAVRLGKLDEAAVGLEYAQRIATSELGSTHPHTLGIRSDYAQLLGELRRLDEAEALQRSILSDMTATLGEAHPLVAQATGNLAHLLEHTGRLDEAIEIGERALALKIAAHGRESEQFVLQTHNLSRYEQRLGRWAEAERRQREMVPIAEKLMPSDHWGLGLVRCAWADSLAKLKRPDEALALLDVCLPPMHAAFGPDSPNQAGFVELQQSLQAADPARAAQEATPAR